MAALTAGTKAPDFSLSGLDGSKFSVAAGACRRGPFSPLFSRFPVRFANTRSRSSSACTKPTASQKVTIVGISQDNPRDTAAFLKSTA